MPTYLRFIKAFLLICFFGWFSTQTATATHLLGGDITYIYLGNNGPANAPYRYRITLKAYVDGTTEVPGLPVSNFFDGNLGNNATLGIYDANTNRLIRTVPIPDEPGEAITKRVQIPVANGCTVSIVDTAIRFFLNTFETEVNLPFALKGYTVLYSGFARSGQIKNLSLRFGGNGGVQTGNTWLANIPSPLTPNSSPQFFDDATTFICLSDTITLANSARDPDGDRLIYSFVRPLDGIQGTGPGGQGPPPINYSAPSSIGYDSTKGFTLLQPLGADGVAEINSASGFTRYHAKEAGAYVIAFDVKEFRTLSNGRDTLLSTTRREIQLLFRDCLPNNPPTPNSGSPGGPVNTAFSITEGEFLTFDVGATDSDSMTISAEADILQGTGGYTGPLAAFPTVTGTGSVSTTFRWQTTCGVSGTFPINVKVVDKGCPPKTAQAVYLVTVKPFTAPRELALGQDSVCGNGTVYTYTLNTTAPDNQFRWVIAGGVLQGGSTGKTVRVIWDPTTNVQTGFLRAIQTSPIGGCKDSTTFSIRVFPLFSVAISTPKPAVCQGDTARLVARGGFGTYAWADISGGPPLDVAGSPDSVVQAVPTANRTYLVTSTNLAGCAVRDTLALRFVPDAAKAGADSAFCAGLQASIGTDSATGYAYAWLPTTGLALPTASQTGVTLLNANQQDTTYTYVQTATERASGCVSTDTVLVLVRALPAITVVADSVVFCSESTARIQASTRVPATFSWLADSPLGVTQSGALSDTNATATYTGKTPDFFTITHTKARILATNVQTGCIGTDSVAVRINPQPQVAFSPQDSACAGTVLTVGVPSLPGYIYKWGITGGLTLSDSTLAQPTVSYPVQFGDTATAYTVSVKINNAFGCSKDSSQTIRRNNLPRVTAGPDKAFCSGDTVQLGTQPNSSYAYLWQSEPSLSPSTSASPAYTAENTPAGGPDRVITLGVLATNSISTCQATDSVQITIYSRPVVQAAATDTLFLCNKDSVQLGTAGRISQSYAWAQVPGLPPEPPARLTGSGTAQPTFASLGGWANNTQTRYHFSYRITATNDTTNCKASDTLRIAINPTPQLYPVVSTDIYPYVDSICSGTQGTITRFNTLSAPQFSIRWTNADGITAADTASFAPTYQVTLPAPGLPRQPVRYYNRITYASTGCADTASVQVLIKAIPVALAGPDVAVCSEGTVQLGVPQIPTLDIRWQPAQDLSDTAAAQPFFTFYNPTQRDSTRQLIMAATTNNGLRCQNTDTLLVTVRPLPIVQAGPDRAVCSDLMVQIGTPPEADRTYAWSPRLGLSDTTQSQPNFTLTNPTQRDSVRTLILQATNTSTPQNCANTDTLLVTVRYLPVADAGPDVAVCSQSSVQIGSAQVPERLYAWSPRLGLADSTVAQPTFTLTNPRAGDSTLFVQVLVTETRTAERCQNTDLVRVVIRALPMIQAGPDLAVCAGAELPIGLPAEPNRRYAWSPPLGIADTTQAQAVFKLDNPTQRDSIRTLVLRGFNTETPQNCSNTDTLLVTVRPLPIAQAGLDSAVCASKALQIGAPTVPERLYTWTPRLGLDDTTLAQPTVSLPNATQRDSVFTYKLGIQETATPQRCTNSDFISITVRHLPIANAGADIAICSQGQALVGTPAVPQRQYAWSPTLGLADSALAQTNLTYTNPTQRDSVIRLSLLVTETRTAQRCQSTDSVAVVVRPLPIVQAGPDVATCSQAGVQVGLPTAPSRAYAWSPRQGVSDTALAQPIFTLTNPTQRDSVRTLVLRATNTANAQNCSNTDTLLVTVRALPLVQAGPDVAVCSALQVQVGTPAEPNRSYAWSPTLGISNDTLAQPTFALANPTQRDSVRRLVLQATNTSTPQRCANTDTLLVTVRYLPIALAGPDVATCSGQLIQLGTAAEPLRAYAWSPATGLNADTLAQPSFSFNNPTQQDSTFAINLLVTETRTPQRCQSTDAVRVTIHPLPLVNAGRDTAYCADSEVQVATPFATGYTYAWQGPVGATIGTPARATTNFSFPNTTQDPITSVVKVLVTVAATTCQATDSLAITTNPRPLNAVLATAPNVVCPSTQNEAYSISNPPAGYTYTWAVSNPATLASGQGTASIRVNWGSTPATNVPISVIGTNTFGCTQRTASLLSVTVNQRLQPQTPVPLSGQTQLCLHQALDGYSTVTSPNSQYTWRYSIAGETTTLVGTNAVSLAWPKPGLAKVWVEEIAAPPPPAGQCFGTSDTLFLTINPSPDTTLAIAGPAALCQFGTALFGLPGFADSRYKWDVLLNNGPDTSAFTGQGQPNIAATLGVAGNYLIRAFETTTQGCPGKARTANLLVNPKPVPTNLAASTYVCPSQTDAAFSIVPGLPNSTYKWLPTGGPTVADQGKTTALVVFNGQQLQRLRVVETSEANCLSDTLEVPFLRDNTALDLLSVSTKEDDDSKVLIRLRMRDNASQTNPVIVQRANAFGTFANFAEVPVAPAGQIIELEDASPLPTGQSANQYLASFANRCGADVRTAIHKTILLAAEGSNINQTANLNWSHYQGFSSLGAYKLFYQLEGQGSFIPLRDKPEVADTVNRVVSNTGGDGFAQAYRVRSMDATNGEVSYSNIVRLVFTNALAKYNIVTPNNDQSNDDLTFANLRLYPQNTLKIYNRWGRLVHETTNYQGGYAPELGGVYTYIFTAGGTTLRGWFEVVK